MKALMTALLTIGFASTALAGGASTPDKCLSADGRFELKYLDDGARLISVKTDAETLADASAISQPLSEGVSFARKGDGRVLLSYQVVKGSQRTKGRVTTYLLQVAGMEPGTDGDLARPVILKCSFRELGR